MNFLERIQTQRVRKRIPFVLGSSTSYSDWIRKHPEDSQQGILYLVENKIFDYLNNSQTILEKYPLEKLAKQRQLMSFNHKGFWHCVDTRRDIESLEKIIHG